MPKDFNDCDIEKGDVVLLPCRVVNITRTIDSEADGLNLGLESVRARDPHGKRPTYHTVNARQVRLATGLELFALNGAVSETEAPTAAELHAAYRELGGGG